MTAALLGDPGKAEGFITEHLPIRNARELGFVHYPFFTQHNPFFEGLREDPEFLELMKQAKAEWEYFGSLPIPAVGG